MDTLREATELLFLLASCFLFFSNPFISWTTGRHDTNSIYPSGFFSLTVFLFRCCFLVLPFSILQLTVKPLNGNKRSVICFLWHSIWAKLSWYKFFPRKLRKSSFILVWKFSRVGMHDGINNFYNRKGTRYFLIIQASLKDKSWEILLGDRNFWKTVVQPLMLKANWNYFHQYFNRRLCNTTLNRYLFLSAKS